MTLGTPLLVGLLEGIDEGALDKLACVSSAVLSEKAGLSMYYLMVR